ncbi:MAG: hypothetical protein HC934_05665 [Acaryochloridaceae cyanobacterium SU_2_1]|nr:hypothetical protein [Acaryochloridaceae cyanobacterium SU_2_1]
MATLTSPDQHSPLTKAADIQQHLQLLGIQYQQWQPQKTPSELPEEILAAYQPQLTILMEASGYITADLIDIHPHTP